MLEAGIHREYMCFLPGMIPVSKEMIGGWRDDEIHH
jgi:hypothetical protein